MCMSERDKERESVCAVIVCLEVVCMCSCVCESKMDSVGGACR